MKERDELHSVENRRTALKHVGIFVIPSVVSFSLSGLAVAASGGSTFTDWADKPSVK